MLGTRVPLPFSYTHTRIQNENSEEGRERQRKGETKFYCIKGKQKTLEKDVTVNVTWR